MQAKEEEDQRSALLRHQHAAAAEASIAAQQMQQQQQVRRLGVGAPTDHLHDPNRDGLDIPVAVPFQEHLFLFQHAEAVDPDLFQIIGGDYSQVVEFNVKPGVAISTEPGFIMHMSEGLESEVDCDVGQGFRRCMAGESCCRLNVHNTTSTNQTAGIVADFPARVIPVNLATYQPNGIYAKSGSFVGAIGKDWKIRLVPVKSIGVACCAGQGLFLNEIRGNSWAFLGAGGTVVEKQLQAGESILVSQAHLVAFEKSVSLDIKLVGGGLCGICFGGLGLFQAKLTGPGKVFLQSMPKETLQKLASRHGGGGGGGNNNGNSGTSTSTS